MKKVSSDAVRAWLLTGLCLCTAAGPALGQAGIGGAGVGGAAGTGGAGGGGAAGLTGFGGSGVFGSSTSLTGSGGTTSLSAPSTGTPQPSGSGSPSSSNPLRPFYMTPQSQGMTLTTSGTTTGGGSATTGMQAFGNPIYSSTSSSTTGGGGALGTPGLRPGGGGTGGAAGGTGSSGTVTIGAPGTPFGFSTIGMVRAPMYSTSLDFPQEVPGLNQLQMALTNVFGADQRLTSRGNIEVAVNAENAVRLRGAVASDRERRLAEGLVRLTPGVRQVYNELTVRSPGP